MAPAAKGSREHLGKWLFTCLGFAAKPMVLGGTLPGPTASKKNYSLFPCWTHPSRRHVAKTAVKGIPKGAFEHVLKLPLERAANMRKMQRNC
jgi:hypothetical protein